MHKHWRGRGRASVSRHFSYANVMASIAVFLALGGTTLAAAAMISGSQIKEHSIPANRLVRGAVVPRAVLANQVSHLFISRAKPRHHSPGGAADQGSGAPSAVVVLSVGQSVTLFQSGPFTITARCTDKGNGAYNIDIDGSATVGWYLGSSRVSAGDTATLYGSGGTPYPAAYTNTGPGMMGVDGESLVLGTFTVTLHLLGDCGFSGSAIG